VKAKADTTCSTSIDLAPELLVASVLVDIANLDRTVFRSFKAGRPLAELVGYVREEDQDRFRRYLERLEDPKLAWVWVREIFRRRKAVSALGA
jgi:hypothetical protein